MMFHFGFSGKFEEKNGRHICKRCNTDWIMK